MVLFRLGGSLVMLAARAGSLVGSPSARLGIANLHRPGAATPLMLLSVGLGLSTLAAVALIEGNVRREITEQLPANAPSFFFVDIQDSQLPHFESIVRAQPGVEEMRQVPSMRARIVAVNGVPAERVQATAGHPMGAARRSRPDLCRRAAAGHPHRRRPAGGLPITTARRWCRSTPTLPAAGASASAT